MLWVWLLLYGLVWPQITMGDLARGSYFQHPDVRELLLNFTVNGAVYGGAPLPQVSVAGGVQFTAEEVSSQEEGLRCVMVRDMSYVKVDADGRVAGFNRRQRGLQNDRRCCRVPDVRSDSLHSGKYDPDAFSVRCLPAFVIAGTQKSGTTVLAASLAQHPKVSFSSKKELHYFNNEDRYKTGLRKGYLGSFPAWNWKDPTFALAPPVHGEATPAYVAHRMACARMARALGPQARILMLLREPVSRLWSEYQMKLRRVLQQDEFVALASKYAAELYACLDSDIGHGVRDLYSETELSDASGPAAPIIQNIAHVWTDIKKCVPQELADHAHWSKLVQSMKAIGGDGEDKWRRILNVCFANSSSGTDHSMEAKEGERKWGEGDVQFRPIECLRKHAKEKAKPLEEAFFGEISAFRDCAANITGVDTSLQQLDKAIDQCVRVQKGIAAQYVYRSTYVAQLYRCFKSLRREQVMVLPAERLRIAPEQTLVSVARFLGLAIPEPRKSYAVTGMLNVSDDSVRAAIRKHFAHFEINTGWRFKSDYEPMQSEVQSRLEEYFAPLNRRLFDFLGENFPEWNQLSPRDV
jgi:hypothetical protein